MSFLSLSRGDPAARDLLQRAIRARYGLRPLPVESVRLEMERQDKGPLGLPVKLVIDCRYITASHWRWDQVRKLFGLAIGRCTMSFDGGAYYERSGKNLTRLTEPRALDGMYRRLWAEAASLLTPLTAPEVIVKSIDECTFQAAQDSESGIVATILLNADDTVAAVETNCYHPTYQREMRLSILPGGGLQTLNGFTVPRQIAFQWADEPPLAFTVINAEANPKIPLTEFSLG